jgi:toxin-antitoxin system PIN domain toxin
MAALPDVNVLLAFVYDAHVHHTAALSWLNNIQQDAEVVLCRFSQLAILRLLNNPAVMGADAKNGAECWNTWDALLADARFHFAGEPQELEDRLRSLTGAFVNQPKRWQDAYLAAFAIASDIEIVTFDAGFRSFPGLRHRILAT